jgi:8-oxo-dGTP diphosphatase
MKRFKLITSIYLILIRDNKILLLRRKNTGYEDGNYGLPAGHLEDNESIREGLAREIKEEIDVDIDVEDLKLVHTMHRREKDIRVDFFFEATKYSGTPINNEPEKCDDLQWFPLDNLPTNTIPYIKTAINNSLDKTIYSEVGWRE